MRCSLVAIGLALVPALMPGLAIAQPLPRLVPIAASPSALPTAIPMPPLVPITREQLAAVAARDAAPTDRMPPRSAGLVPIAFAPASTIAALPPTAAPPRPLPIQDSLRSLPLPPPLPPAPVVVRPPVASLPPAPAPAPAPLPAPLPARLPPPLPTAAAPVILPPLPSVAAQSLPPVAEPRIPPLPAPLPVPLPAPLPVAAPQSPVLPPVAPPPPVVATAPAPPAQPLPALPVAPHTQPPLPAALPPLPVASTAASPVPALPAAPVPSPAPASQPLPPLPAAPVSAPGAPPAVAPGKPADAITIGSFNIQVFGESKISKPHVVDVLVRVVRGFDVVAIQEVRAKSDSVIPQFVSAINADGSRYQFVIGPRLGRTSSKEQYTFIYDSTRIELDPSSVGTSPNPGDRLHRPPLHARFRTRANPPEAGFSFWLVDTHTDPDEVKQEVDALAQVFTEMKALRPDEDDVILLGDLNAAPQQFGRIRQIPGIGWAVSGVPTNTRRNKTYDNIIFDQAATAEYTGRWGVLDLQNTFGLSLDKALEVSDHNPVWATFRPWEARQLAATDAGAAVR